MRHVALSGRLQAVAAMVTEGNRVCDVGCDHGFVPIYLALQGISPAVLAMDVKSGPLSAAREHVTEYGLENVIETRLSDGLHNYNTGEADTLVCAGMGGRLMMRILSDDQGKTESFHELILQPQSEIEQLRAWLREQGYRITDEDMIEEDGKFYSMMRVETGEDTGIGELHEYVAKLRNSAENSKCDYADDKKLCKLIDRYGPVLLQRRDKTLTAYLRREERIYEEILSTLQAQGLADEKRKDRHAEVSELLNDCRMALDIMVLGHRMKGTDLR